MLLTVMAAPSISGAQSIVAFRDGDGQWAWAEASSTQSFARKSLAADETVGGAFTVSYEDVNFETGVGFDDPVSGAARRDTLRAVLLYVSSVLDVPGTADLLVRASQTDGRGALASAGPYLLPFSGFQGGLVFEHLTSAVDPLSDELDGTLTVDFGYRWSTDADGPSPVEFDLYSTLLHEVTHALGILSVVGSDGGSALGNQGGFGLFSIFDSFLVRGATGQPLYLDEGEINASSEDVTSEDVIFAGSRSAAEYGSFPPVFAPSPFLEGSSIGHWSFETGANVVMLPAVERGEGRREYASWELQALADLGYDVVVCGDGFVAGAERCDDGNLEALDGCSASCELEDIVVDDAGIPDPPDAGIPDASVPDASIPDAGVPSANIPDGGVPNTGEPDASIPDETVGADTPSNSGDSPGSQSTPDLPEPLPSEGERPPAASSEPPVGCSTGGVPTVAIWPMLLLLLLSARRRFVS